MRRLTSHNCFPEDVRGSKVGGWATLLICSSLRPAAVEEEVSDFFREVLKEFILVERRDSRPDVVF